MLQVCFSPALFLHCLWYGPWVDVVVVPAVIPISCCSLAVCSWHAWGTPAVAGLVGWGEAIGNALPPEGRCLEPGTTSQTVFPYLNHIKPNLQKYIYIWKSPDFSRLMILCCIKVTKLWSPIQGTLPWTCTPAYKALQSRHQPPVLQIGFWNFKWKCIFIYSLGTFFDHNKQI